MNQSAVDVRCDAASSIRGGRYDAGAWLLLPIAAVIAAVLACAPAARVVGYPIIEDGYYSLSIARQIALGHGITIDGSTWTNGFQPLWVFLLVPVYWTTSGARIATLRLVLVCAALIWAATALILAAVASQLTPRRHAAATWTVILYLTSRTIFEQHFNGLETGLLLFIFATLGWIANHSAWTSGRTMAIAIVCGLLVLTRIDTALFVVLFTMAIALFPRSEAARARLTRAATVAFVSAVVSLPWWLYNLLRFGSLLPSSGSAVFDWRWRPGRALVLALFAAGHAIPLPIRPFWPWRYEWCGAAALALAMGVVIRRGHGVGRLARSVVAMMDEHPLARLVGVLALYLFVIVAVYAMSPAWWMYERYTSPVVVLSVPALAIAIASRIGRRGALAAALVAAMCLIVGIRQQVRSPINGVYQNQLALVRRHVPDGTPVAALQTGTFGYFRDHVVNLDGKVNAAALHAHGHLNDYLQRTGVDWVADWPWLVQDSLGSLDGWRFVEQTDQPECLPCRFALYARHAQ